jgi:hypothetical protein
MGDGYFKYNKTVICTDNFSLDVVNKIIRVLDKKFGLKSVAIRRRNPNGNIV